MLHTLQNIGRGRVEVLNSGVDLSIWQDFVDLQLSAELMICNEVTAIKEGVEQCSCRIARTEGSPARESIRAARGLTRRGSPNTAEARDGHDTERDLKNV